MLFIFLNNFKLTRNTNDILKLIMLRITNETNCCLYNSNIGVDKFFYNKFHSLRYWVGRIPLIHYVVV